MGLLVKNTLDALEPFAPETLLPLRWRSPVPAPKRWRPERH
jgi:hypothetical protein